MNHLAQRLLEVTWTFRSDVGRWSCRARENWRDIEKKEDLMIKEET
jgi:hypothetical protein